MPTLNIELDQLDYDCIVATVARYQVTHRWDDGQLMLPEGESSVAGAVLAEICRDYEEYREQK